MAGARSPVARALFGVACLGAALGLISRAFIVAPTGMTPHRGVQARADGVASKNGTLPGSAWSFGTLLAAGAVGIACSGVAAAAKRRTTLQYTTQSIIPSLAWLKTGFKVKDFDGGAIRTICLAGVDIAVGKTASGKIFALGDKAPPTGISLGVGGEVEGELVVEPQYGCRFNPFTGEPEGDWCPSPPVIGAAIGAFMGGPQAIAVFECRTGFLSDEVEVLIDTNARRAYEADYWKGVLDAQGKDDGTYY